MHRSCPVLRHVVTEAHVRQLGSALRPLYVVAFMPPVWGSKPGASRGRGALCSASHRYQCPGHPGEAPLWMSWRRHADTVKLQLRRHLGSHFSEEAPQ